MENHQQLQKVEGVFSKKLYLTILIKWLKNLNEYRKTLKGNFKKSSKMNQITEVLKE